MPTRRFATDYHFRFARARGRVLRTQSCCSVWSHNLCGARKSCLPNDRPLSGAPSRDIEAGPVAAYSPRQPVGRTTAARRLATSWSDRPSRPARDGSLATLESLTHPTWSVRCGDGAPNTGRRWGAQVRLIPLPDTWLNPASTRNPLPTNDYATILREHPICSIALCKALFFRGGGRPDGSRVLRSNPARAPRGDANAGFRDG